MICSSRSPAWSGGNKWAPVFPVKGLGVGKPSEEKLHALISTWIRWVDETLPHSMFAEINGIEPMMDPSAAVGLGSQTSDLLPPAQGPLQVGEQVVVVKQFTKKHPLPHHAEFKIGLLPNSEAFVVCVRRLEEGYVTVKVS